MQLKIIAGLVVLVLFAAALGGLQYYRAEYNRVNGELEIVKEVNEQNQATIISLRNSITQNEQALAAVRSAAAASQQQSQDVIRRLLNAPRTTACINNDTIAPVIDRLRRPVSPAQNPTR
jgi:hypothetical protein